MVTSTILGPNGEPIRRAELAEPQTAKLIGLQHEVGNHPTRGLTPARLAAILDAAEQGDIIAQHELYEDIEEKDAHVAAEMGKRRRAIIGLEWEILPPDQPTAAETAAAERVAELIEAMGSIEDVLFDLTDAIGKGFVCLELDWRRRDGLWLPADVLHRPQSWFQLHRGFKQEIRLRGAAGGEPLQPFGWITHTHRAKSGYLERAALFRTLVWPYLFKNYSVGDLAEFLEIYGIPLRVGKYPPGAKPDEKSTLLRALASIGHNAAGIIPQGMEIEFVKAAEGDPAAYALMIGWCERSQSKAILGGTLTSDSTAGTNTNALGNVHNEVRLDLRDADARQIAATLSRALLFPIAALNGLATDYGRAPRWNFDLSEPEDIGAYATALPALVGIGLRIPRQWAQERLGIPEPQDDEEVLSSAASAPPAGLAGLRAALTSQATRRGPATPEAMVERADTDIQPATDAWIDQIRQLVATATDLAEVRDGLNALLKTMPLDAYAAAFADALAAAALAGRYELMEEASGR